jgi:hypothetical protein
MTNFNSTFKQIIQGLKIIRNWVNIFRGKT